MTLLITSKRFLGAVKEASYGVTPTTAPRWLPVKNPQPEHMIKMIEDEGLRGIPAQVFGEYQGPQNGQFSYEFDWYGTDTPILIPAIVGPDVVTGAGPYTHTFKLATGQPASLSLEDFNGDEQWQMAGSLLSDLTFKLNAEGQLSATASGQSFHPTAVAAGGPTYAAESFFVGWQATVSLGGSPNTRVISGEFAFKRKLTPRWTANNSQDPKVIFAGPLDFAGKLTLDVEDHSELDYFRNNTQPAMVVTFTNGTLQLVIQCTKTAFKTAKHNSSNDWLQLDADFRGVYNATDAGPALLKVINSQAAAY